MDPRLYILMRTDLASMNSGKGMAQAAHAANAFAHAVAKVIASPETYTLLHAAQNWKNQTTQGFGTTITLEVESEKCMNALVTLGSGFGFLTGIVHDPTYPVRDGNVTHLIPINTCAYIFSQNGMPVLLETLDLHP